MQAMQKVIELAKKVASKLSGGAGLGGVNSTFLKQVLLRHATMGCFAQWVQFFMRSYELIYSSMVVPQTDALHDSWLCHSEFASSSI
jgi:hypothetical protein